MKIKYIYIVDLTDDEILSYPETVESKLKRSHEDNDSDDDENDVERVKGSDAEEEEEDGKEKEKADENEGGNDDDDDEDAPTMPSSPFSKPAVPKGASKKKEKEMKIEKDEEKEKEKETPIKAKKTDGKLPSKTAKRSTKKVKDEVKDENDDSQKKGQQTPKKSETAKSEDKEKKKKTPSKKTETEAKQTKRKKESENESGDENEEEDSKHPSKPLKKKPKTENPEKKKKEEKPKVSKKIKRKIDEDNDNDKDSDDDIDAIRDELLIRNPNDLRAFDVTGPVILLTRCSKVQARLYRSIKALGGRITDSVDCATHVVCGDTGRTAKLMEGILRGLWVVSKTWVLASAKAGSWVEEELYELAEVFPGAKKSRVAHARGVDEKGCLFAGLTFFVDKARGADDLEPKIVKKIVAEGGGELLKMKDVGSAMYYVVGKGATPSCTVPRSVSVIKSTRIYDAIVLYEKL